MKRLFFALLCGFTIVCSASGYQVLSSKEFGGGDAKNQNVVVKCTTDTGKLSSQTCSLRRYVKCSGKTCNGWQPWRDLRDTTSQYSDWRAAAAACCRAKGLR